MSELRAAAPGIHRTLGKAVAQRDPLHRTPEALLDLRDPEGGMSNV